MQTGLFNSVHPEIKNFRMKLSALSGQLNLLFLMYLAES